jgi:4-hydroxy-tetrahydrodipicolinate synthase
VVKGVLHAEGRIPTAGVRLPLLPAADETVRAALRHSVVERVAEHVAGPSVDVDVVLR